MTMTLADLIETTGRTVDDHLPIDIDIPVLAGLQCQGDVAVVPFDATAVTLRHDAEWATIPPAGIEVVSAVATGHDHVLTAGPGAGSWTTAVRDPEGLAVGVLDCTEPVYLLHPEHGGTGIAPGRYVIRRQREMADVQRLVAD